MTKLLIYYITYHNISVTTVSIKCDPKKDFICVLTCLTNSKIVIL